MQVMTKGWQSRGEGKVEDEGQGSERQQKWAADYNKSKRGTTIKVGGGLQQKWVVDVKDSGRRGKNRKGKRGGILLLININAVVD